MITCMLSVSILSGCSDNSTIGTQGMTAPAPIAATKDPDQIYKDESLEIMQDMSANKELFENCTDEKIREKYEKISYDADSKRIIR